MKGKREVLMKNWLLLFFTVTLVGMAVGFADSAYAQCTCFTRAVLINSVVEDENEDLLHLTPAAETGLISITLNKSPFGFMNRLPTLCIKNSTEGTVLLNLTEEETAACIRLMNNNIPDPF